MAPLLDQAQYQAILEGLPEGIYVVDANRKIIFWNDGAERITGYLRQEVLGRLCQNDLLMHCDESRNILCGEHCPLVEAMWDGKPRDVSTWLRHKDGGRLPVRVRSIPLRNENGAIIGAVESFEEILGSPELSSPADSKPILSRAAIETALKSSLEILAAGGAPFSLLMVELNDLASIRAHHSPEAAHKAFQTMTETLVGNVSASDLVGRWAEDRFLVMLRNCSSADLKHKAASLEGIADEVAVSWWGDRISVAVTVGGAAAVQGDSVASVVARCEQALSAAGNSGKRIVIL